MIERGSQSLFGSLFPLKASLQILVVCLDALGIPRSGRVLIRPENVCLQRALHRSRDLLVDREDVAQLALVTFRPQMAAVRDIDELHCHPDSIPRLAHAALDHLADVQQPPNLANVAGGVSELEARSSRHHTQPANLREVMDELVCQAVTEILVL